MLSSLAVFITEFCFDRFPQMAVIKEIVQLLPISSISWPSLFCFYFDLKQSQVKKPISRNGYGPDWLRRFKDRPDSYAMLMSANKGETAAHGCHCPGDMAVRMREVQARPWIGACVPLALSLS